jgi:hypothetical protein
MTRDTRKLLEDALKLPPEERAALAGTLLDNLDCDVDPEVEAAWAEEFEGRARVIVAGIVELVPWFDPAVHCGSR